ncbi:hypothetical protein P3L10_021200 [Capsicum annuum]
MLKEMDDVDMLTLVVQEMSKNFPTLWTKLVHERDLLFLLHQCTSIQLREFLQLQIRMTMNQTLGRVTCPESRITGNNPLRLRSYSQFLHRNVPFPSRESCQHLELQWPGWP